MERRIICLCFILTFCLTGCSIPDMRVLQLNQSSKTEAESIKYIEDTVVQALETKDVELLKSVFSEQALERANDIELGIEYMFDIYEGDFVEITHSNHSADKHIEKNNSWTCIYGQCHIETSQKVYVLSWSDWIKHTGNPSAVGVYKMNLREYKEGEYYSYMDIAGVNYPKRDQIHNTLRNFLDISSDTSDEEICSLFSEKLLANASDAEKEKLYWFLSRLRLANMKGAWVNYGEVEGQKKTDVYLEVSGSYILYFSYDLEETDKISAMKLTRIQEGKTEKDYVLEMDGCGAEGFVEFYEERKE